MTGHVHKLRWIHQGFKLSYVAMLDGLEVVNRLLQSVVIDMVVDRAHGDIGQDGVGSGLLGAALRLGFLGLPDG